MKKYYFTFFAFIYITVLNANISTPKIFGNNMVLQRDLEIPVWGKADPGEKVTVFFKNQKKSAVADKKGSWIIKLSPEPFGGPFNLTIKGKNEIVFTNVLLGDVWICSGQSNMEWILKNTENAEKEIINANFDKIRLLTVEKATSLDPVNDIKTNGWLDCNSESAKDFSAVAYYFGKYLHNEVNIPMGLISTNWGGTGVETWTSEEACLNDEYLKKWLDESNAIDLETLKKQELQKAENYKISLDKALGTEDNLHPFAKGDFNDKEWREITLPGLWEDSEIGTFDGIVWFRKTFILPADFQSSGANLFIGKIDDSDITWINGKFIGRTHWQYSKLREYKIPEDVLKPGENTIIVRVEDYLGGGGIYGEDDGMKIIHKDGELSLTGKWKYFKEDIAIPRNPDNPGASILEPNNYPSLLFNAMIYPLIPFGIKGAIWYQGENNAGSINQSVKYRDLFANMINDWRKQWNQGDFSFYFVQLANYMKPQTVPTDEPWPYLRESQAKITEMLPNTGMACIIDIGDGNDIHPRNKKDVGKRLALNALKFNYGKDIEFSGPTVKSVTFEDNKAIITFDHTAKGLIVKDKYGYVNGFAVAGDNGIFYFAKAEITSANTIVVHGKKSDKLKAVRYAWANNPDDVNLYNSEDLPAVPFRTDE